MHRGYGAAARHKMHERASRRPTTVGMCVHSLCNRESIASNGSMWKFLSLTSRTRPSYFNPFNRSVTTWRCRSSSLITTQSTNWTMKTVTQLFSIFFGLAVSSPSPPPPRPSSLFLKRRIAVRDTTRRTFSRFLLVSSARHSIHTCLSSATPLLRSHSFFALKYTSSNSKSILHEALIDYNISQLLNYSIS